MQLLDQLGRHQGLEVITQLLVEAPVVDLILVPDLGGFLGQRFPSFFGAFGAARAFPLVAELDELIANAEQSVARE